MRKVPDETYEMLAEQIMFSGNINNTLIDFMEKHQLQFRKGKCTADINSAIVKARKNGIGKVEFELSMLAVYLKDIFKSK